MKSALIALLALSLCYLPGCLTVSTTDQDARTVAGNWLDLLDTGSFEQARREQAPRILAAGADAQFVGYMKSRRAPLGKPKSRAFYRVTTTHKMSGAPDGNYEVIIFKTVFEHKALAYERVIVTGENGRWQVSGYGFQ